MFQGNWTCEKCGGSITELPFQPKSEKGLTCRDCFFKSKNGGQPAPAAQPAAGEQDDREAPPFDPSEAPVAGEQATDSPDRASAPSASSERQMFEGEWQCAECGGAITKLPFEPRSTENLKCIDCFKKSRG